MFNRFIVLSASLLFSSAAICRAQSAQEVHTYISEHKQTALKFEKEYGIPASITLAQGILESGAGTSSLTKASNNHFCIKAGTQWKGAVYLAWDDETAKSRFRSYASAAESFDDYARLLRNGAPYRSLFAISVYDYRGWAHGLKRCGYATAPNYAAVLIGLIEQYKLYALNGGVKLRPGKTAIITRYVEKQRPDFDRACVMDDEEITEEQSVIIEALRRYAVEINGIHCTVVQPGETLASVARKHDISPLLLLKYNELQSEYQVKAGDIVYLGKKRKKYLGAQDFYVADKDRTLYEVSQLFGIRMHSLARLNDLQDDARLGSGTRVILK